MVSKTRRESGPNSNVLRLTVERPRVNSWSSRLILDVSLELDPVGIILVVLLLGEDGIRDARRSNDIVSRLRLGDVDLVGNRVDSSSLELGLDSMSEKSIASGVSNVHDAFLRVARGLNHGDVAGGNDLVDKCEVLGRKIGESGDIDLVDDEESGLVGEKRLDRVEELALHDGAKVMVSTSVKPEIELRRDRRT